MKLIDRYPDFLPIYEEIMAFRTKPEELMMKSSEALQIMDHNTELYMIDQMRQENSQLQKEIEQLRSQLREKNSESKDA